MVIIPTDEALATVLYENIQFEKIYEDDVAVIYSKI